MSEDNHLLKIQAMVARGELSPAPGDVQHIDVLHDDWCSIFNGGRCDCKPDIRLRWSHAATSMN